MPIPTKYQDAIGRLEPVGEGVLQGAMLGSIGTNRHIVVLVDLAFLGEVMGVSAAAIRR